MFISSVAMTLLIATGLGCFLRSARQRWRLMLVAAAPEARFDQKPRRLRALLKYGLLQKRMFRYQLAGIAHAFIFFGFLVLLLRSIIMFGRGYDADFGLWILGEHQILGAFYAFAKDIVGVLVVCGVMVFFYYRQVAKLQRMTASREALVILGLIVGLIAADMTYEASGFVLSANAAASEPAAPAGELAGQTADQANMPPAGQPTAASSAEPVPIVHAYTPAASLWAVVLSIFPSGVLSVLHFAGFWAHSIIVLTFLNLLPRGKHFHVLTVLPNVYLQTLKPLGRLAPIDDIEGRIEREQTLGVKTVRDLSWKSVLDLYTCTECGRCSDHCPATKTGKLLSPKQLTIDLRDHLYANESQLLAPLPDAKTSGEDGNGAGGRQPPADELVPEWIKPEVLWACTTCGACEQECPVFISYIDKIVDMRRHLVMERGEFPSQLQNAFRGMETVGNVYSFANEQRADWAVGLNVPLISEKPDADVLYWVGCSPSFDDRARKIARATAQLLQEAGVSFAILGPEEQCTGDPARRAGNEYLFQTLARANVEKLNSYKPKRIVATCPHCYNTLKNEYPDFDGRYEVVHHTVFLAELLRDGKLKPRHRVEGAFTYHDACYLGRHNGEYNAPREVLNSIPGLKLSEPAETRDRGMCCGAGGAQMWKEEEPGEGKVNHARTNQLLRVLPNADAPRTIATACPFCMTMLTDGLRDQGHDEVVQKDVAELLLEAVKGASDTAGE